MPQRQRRRSRKFSLDDPIQKVVKPDEKKSSVDSSGEGSPIFEHFEELRLRLIYSILYLVAGCLVGFFVTEKYLFAWMLSPILNIPDAHLQVLGPAEKLTSFFKTSFIVGLVIALPFIVHQIWLFLRPGLKLVERRFLLLFIPASALLFIAGAAFVFFVMIPASLRFLIGFNLGVDIETGITLDRYFSFVLMLVLAGGLIFQVPLITFFLAKIGVVTAKMLASQRKIAIVLTVFLAAVLTPTGDPFNLMLLALPIYILFEISIVVAFLTARAKSSS